MPCVAVLGSSFWGSTNCGWSLYLPGMYAAAEKEVACVRHIRPVKLVLAFISMEPVPSHPPQHPRRVSKLFALSHETEGLLLSVVQQYDIEYRPWFYKPLPSFRRNTASNETRYVQKGALGFLLKHPKLHRTEHSPSRTSSLWFLVHFTRPPTRRGGAAK